MPEPTTGQIALLIASIALFAIGSGLSLARIKWERNSLRIAAKACGYCGVLVGVGVLVCHSIDQRNWGPEDQFDLAIWSGRFFRMAASVAGDVLAAEDNFGMLILLGLLLALFVLYMQRARPLAGLDWFVMPIVILLLVAAGVFGSTKPHEYLRGAWSWVHRVTAYGGALAFSVAGAVGAMYLIVSRRLRAKTAVAGPHLGSLERLEHLTFISVTLGFALFTVAVVTGLAKLREHGMQPAKLLLATSVWVVYAIVLHSPINPSFRGRKTAILSVFGFLLMVGTIVAVEF